MFELGEKVVCVDDFHHDINNNKILGIEVGQVYTIAGFSKRHNYVIVFLEETINNYSYPAGIPIYTPEKEDCGYYAFRFRKLIKKKTKTDISIFHNIRKNVEDNPSVYQDENENV